MEIYSRTGLPRQRTSFLCCKIRLGHFHCSPHPENRHKLGNLQEFNFPAPQLSDTTAIDYEDSGTLRILTTGVDDYYIKYEVDTVTGSFIADTTPIRGICDSYIFGPPSINSCDFSIHDASIEPGTNTLWALGWRSGFLFRINLDTNEVESLSTNMDSMFSLAWSPAAFNDDNAPSCVQTYTNDPRARWSALVPDWEETIELFFSTLTNLDDLELRNPRLGFKNDKDGMGKKTVFVGINVDVVLPLELVLDVSHLFCSCDVPSRPKDSYTVSPLLDLLVEVAIPIKLLDICNVGAVIPLPPLAFLAVSTCKVAKVIIAVESWMRNGLSAQVAPCVSVAIRENIYNDDSFITQQLTSEYFCINGELPK